MPARCVAASARVFSTLDSLLEEEKPTAPAPAPVVRPRPTPSHPTLRNAQRSATGRELEAHEPTIVAAAALFAERSKRSLRNPRSTSTPKRTRQAGRRVLHFIGG